MGSHHPSGHFARGFRSFWAFLSKLWPNYSQILAILGVPQNRVFSDCRQNFLNVDAPIQNFFGGSFQSWSHLKSCPGDF